MVQNGQWNKVSFIKKLLDTTDPSDAEWILYMEDDTIIDAPGFTLPFEFYAGKDIILLGNPATIRAGDPKGRVFAALCCLSWPVYNKQKERAGIWHYDLSPSNAIVAAAFLWKCEQYAAVLSWLTICPCSWQLRSSQAFGMIVSPWSMIMQHPTILSAMWHALIAIASSITPGQLCGKDCTGYCITAFLMSASLCAAGLDFGVVLIRNSERSKQLFGELVGKSSQFQVHTTPAHHMQCHSSAQRHVFEMLQRSY